MNQILSTENVSNKYSKKKSVSRDINSVIKFFAIMLIIFGVFIIASSSYAIYKSNGNGGQDNNTSNEGQDETKPSIEVQIKDEKQLIVNISSTQPAVIDKVVYHWNDEEEKTFTGDGRTYMQISKIDIPRGENTFTVVATDVNGQETVFSDTYTLESEINIDMEQSGNVIKVNATGINDIKAIAYKLDSEKAQLQKAEGKENSFEIQIPTGEHTVRVRVLDVNGNTETKEMTVTGATSPTLTITPGNNCYIIKAHDDVALSKLEIETVANGKITSMTIDGKDFETTIPLKKGDDNHIKVTVYNSQGVPSETKEAVWKL